MGKDNEVDEQCGTATAEATATEAEETVAKSKTDVIDAGDIDKLTEMAQKLVEILGVEKTLDLVAGEKSESPWGEGEKQPRSTKTWAIKLAKNIKEVAEVTEQGDGQLVPTNDALLEWIKPFNRLVIEESKLGDTEDIAPISDLYIATMLTMADGIWLDYCGLPKPMGMTLHIANSVKPIKGDIVSETRAKFKNKVYGVIDNGTGSNDHYVKKEKYYLRMFKFCAEKAKAKIADRAYELWQRDNRGDLSNWLRAEEELNADKNFYPSKWAMAGKYLVGLPNLDACKIVRRGHWSKNYKFTTIYNVVSPNGVTAWAETGTYSRDRRRVEIFFNTQQTVKGFDMKLETRALEKLRGMVTDEQWNNYMLSGVIEERSPKSKILYYVRKLKPTLAFKIKNDDKGESFQFIIGLCMHPMAYYMDSFTGCLCPTDDVISHLLWIRGDEHGFWGKANHHPLEQVEAGIP